MRFFNSILSVGALVILSVSCSNVDFKKTKGGMPYKLFSDNSNGAKAQAGNILKVNFQYKIKDSTAFSSYGTFPVYLQVSNTTNPYDITEILPNLKKGDSVYAVQLVDTFLKRDPANIPPQFKKGDKIVTTIKVLDIFTSQETAQKDREKEIGKMLQKEDVAMKDYLSKNNIQAEKTGTGTYVQMINPGQGAPVENGKYVTLMYKGSTFGGKVFDSNMDPSFGHTQPLGFTVGEGGAIKGFDEGLHSLKKGSKARIFIPSMLAYGPQPPTPVIKPFENLIFDVEVLDVADKAPAPQQMPSVRRDTAAMK